MEYVAIAFVLTKVNFEMEEKNTSDSWHDLFPDRHADTTHTQGNYECYIVALYFHLYVSQINHTNQSYKPLSDK